MHYVDLFPSSNNDDIFRLTGLLHTRVVVQEINTKKQPTQCKRCQLYGHSHNYCHLSFRCVKCGVKHDTKLCTKSLEIKPTCALCKGEHPANYR